MQVADLISRWFELLAIIVTDQQALWQARKSIMVTPEGEGFVVRRAGTDDSSVLVSLTKGAALPSEALQRLRKHFVVFALPNESVVTRRLSVPAQAKDYLAGIVRNQMERLSPWPLAQAVYGFTNKPSEADPSMLDVRVFIVARNQIETIRDELNAFGLPPDQIAVQPVQESIQDPRAAFVSLWKRVAQTQQHQAFNLPRMIGFGTAAMVVLSLAVSLWALYSTSLIASEQDEVSASVQALKRRSQAGQPQQMASLSPPERAWALKDTTPAAVMVIEALTRALPDSAYLTDLRLENASLRITGLAVDAPSLIGALEQSHRFSDVHFFAPTTKGQDGGLYRFYIEARIEPRLVLIGD
jgi:general secretion pathway protein L